MSYSHQTDPELGHLVVEENSRRYEGWQNLEGESAEMIVGPPLVFDERRYCDRNYLQDDSSDGYKYKMSSLPYYCRNPPATATLHTLNEPHLQKSDLELQLSYSRQVYVILAMILMTIFGTVAAFFYKQDWREWCVTNPAFFLTAKGLSIICILPLLCCQSVRRTFPVNVVFLGSFTISWGFAFASIAISYNMPYIPMAIGTAALMSLLLVALASSKSDLNMAKWSAILVPIAIVIMYGFFAIFFSFPKMQLVYAQLLALVFMLMAIAFVYKTTPVSGRIVKGRHNNIQSL